MAEPTLDRLRALGSGGSPVGKVRQMAEDLLHAVQMLAAVALILLWIWISLPAVAPKATSAAMQDWLKELLGHMVNNGLLLFGGVAGSALLVGGLLYALSHHEHGQRALKGGGILLLVVAGVGFAKSAFPSLLGSLS